MKVLHVLYQSLPQISGSSIRSRDILMSQQEFGIEVVAITSPFQSGSSEVEYLDNIRYVRTSIREESDISDKQRPLIKRLTRLFKIFSFRNKIKKLIIDEKPDIIHAHAMFFCGLPSLFLGKKFGIPVVYEVRSLWMLNKEKSNKNYIKKIVEKTIYKVELFVMKRVSKVVVINENLKTELVQNGISNKNIEIIKNAVNVTLINHLKTQAVSKNCPTAECVFGYIGTLTPHEGIDFLIDSFKDFNIMHPKTKLIIYGSGIQTTIVKQMSDKTTNVHFMGSIKPNEVFKAFADIDVIVNPRYRNKLTESVTPLKPLEAMAYGKIFIGSDVGGIKELVDDNKNGFLFKAGKKQALIDKMSFVLELSKKEKENVIASAYNYVIKKKSWLRNASGYNEIYKTLKR